MVEAADWACQTESDQGERDSNYDQLQEAANYTQPEESQDRK